MELGDSGCAALTGGNHEHQEHGERHVTGVHVGLLATA